MAYSQTYIRSLGELRNNALLLVIANAHLCEENLIIKIGKSVYKNAQLLKDDIAALRKEYPGKFAKEVETDSIIDKINETAQSMLQPSEELLETCLQSKLGSQLESYIKSITCAVNEIRDQVEGKGLVSDRKTSSTELAYNVESVWDSIGSTVIQGLKVFLCLFIVAALAFGYLYFTLESESSVQNTINSSEAHILGQQKIISELESERGKLMDDIEEMEKKDLLRKDKIAILDINVKIHSIEEKIHAAQTEIEQYNEKIADSQTRLEDIKRKTFIERLLRR